MRKDPLYAHINENGKAFNGRRGPVPLAFAASFCFIATFTIVPAFYAVVAWVLG